MKNNRLRLSIIGLTASISVMIFFALACGGGSKGPDESTELHKVRESVKDGDFEITLSRIRARKRVGGRFINETAPKGAVFIVVDYKFKNISDEPVSSFSQPGAELYSPENTEYDTAAGASAAYATEKKQTKKSFSDLNPGITATDADVFEVAAELWKKKGWKVRIGDVFYKAN